MSNLLYLGAAAAISAVGMFVLWLARRRPRSMQAGMDAFNRELRALAPREHRRISSSVDPAGPAPIRPRPTEPDRHRRPGARPADRSARPGAHRDKD
jgi:hypothetical protein